MSASDCPECGHDWSEHIRSAGCLGSYGPCSCDREPSPLVRTRERAKAREREATVDYLRLWADDLDTVASLSPPTNRLIATALRQAADTIDAGRHRWPATRQRIKEHRKGRRFALLRKHGLLPAKKGSP